MTNTAHEQSKALLHCTQITPAVVAVLLLAARLKSKWNSVVAELQGLTALRGRVFGSDFATSATL